MAKESLPLPVDPQKRADVLTDALCAAIEALAVADPRLGLEAVQNARARLDASEAVAIRAGLDRSDWLVARAATLLGYPRTSSLQRLLETRHEAIREDVRAHRKATGYETGRPRKPEQE